MTTLNDISLYVGGDLSPSAVGDLLSANGTIRGQQRVLRRLLTNQGEYLFHPTYGAGLPSFVGQVADVAKIQALIRSQILLEDAVARSPAPVITVTPINRGITGGLAVSIQYVDSVTNQSTSLNFNVSQ